MVCKVAMSGIRARGRQALGHVLKNPQNIKTLEAALYKECESDEQYLLAMYQLVSRDITSGTKLTPLLQKIRAGHIGWKHECFKDVASKLEERDAFITGNGEEVEEGVLQCTKCKSWRVHSLQSQSRSGDEGMTVYAQCAECRHNWVEHG